MMGEDSRIMGLLRDTTLRYPAEPQQVRFPYAALSPAIYRLDDYIKTHITLGICNNGKQEDG